MQVTHNPNIGNEGKVTETGSSSAAMNMVVGAVQSDKNISLVTGGEGLVVRPSDIANPKPKDDADKAEKISDGVVRLTLKRSQLLYDIGNYAFVEGHIMPDEAEHVRHMVKDIDADGNVDRVNRMLTLYHARVTELLYEYVKQAVEVDEEGIELSDVMREPAAYVIDIRVPDGFSISSAKLLVAAIHEYLVAHVLADWFSIVNPEREATWAAKAQSAEAEIMGAMARRIGGITRRMFPFG